MHVSVEIWQPLTGLRPNGIGWSATTGRPAGELSLDADWLI